MRKHKFSDVSLVENLNTLIFAKEFYKIADFNNNGVLTLEEISTSFVGLGISSNPDFLMRVFRL